MTKKKYLKNKNKTFKIKSCSPSQELNFTCYSNK